MTSNGNKTEEGDVVPIDQSGTYRLGRAMPALSPGPELTAHGPIQAHGPAATTLFALWPFTRPVHAFRAPGGYRTQADIVNRSRDLRAAMGPGRRGWEGPLTTPRNRATSHSGGSS
ncbi:MAG: respiratory nitrate reductase subunit gamma [Micromonosporaceae bacterium]|nr:respiratory nitrate reductase subunit gamma [Micromonosporaceae bacterium]